jgi:hypothetical protein
MKFILLLVVAAVIAASVKAVDSWKCNFCVIGLGLLEQEELQVRLESALEAKCNFEAKCAVDVKAQCAVDLDAKCGGKKHKFEREACEVKEKGEEKVCEEKTKLKVKECEVKGKLEDKVCHKAVDEVMHLLLKKLQPDALCKHMNLCEGFEECELFPTWPLKHVPDQPKSWPVERRLEAQEALQGIDWKKLETKALEKFLNEIFEKQILPKEEGSSKFYRMTNVITALMQHIFGHKEEDPSGVPEYDKCGKDLKCKEQALEKHLPLQDMDGDRFSTIKTLRGSDWRGEDCDDVNHDVYPGRAMESKSLLGRDIDHNCNKVMGGNSTASYEDLFCKGTDQRGLIMLGDSATAHFHLPPQYMTAQGWNIDGIVKFAEDEMDFPQCSWGTGHVDLEKCPFQDPVPGVTKVTSLYTQLRERNRCNHNDYQNIGVNGARITSSMGLVDAVARRPEVDHPVLLWMSLIGNDVCNGHPGTDSMTTPDKFREDALASLAALDKTLPKGSYVVSLGLFNGELLYDTMHDQQHPLGPSYSQVYDWMNCMKESPCWGWLNSDAEARKSASDRAKQLNDVYVDIAASSKFNNFEYIYYPGEYIKLFADYEKSMGKEALPNLIEKADGFHPSQAANAIFAEKFFAFLEKEHPDAIGPINPNNAAIDAMFFA